LPREKARGSLVVFILLKTKLPGAMMSAGASLFDQFICEIASNLFIDLLMLLTVLTVLASFAEANADIVATPPEAVLFVTIVY
jgi:hypothetical protein